MLFSSLLVLVPVPAALSRLDHTAFIVIDTPVILICASWSDGPVACIYANQ